MTSTQTLIKTANGYTYNGVNIKRTINANGKPIFSFDTDWFGHIIESDFKSLKAAKTRIDATIGIHHGVFGSIRANFEVANGVIISK